MHILLLHCLEQLFMSPKKKSPVLVETLAKQAEPELGWGRSSAFLCPVGTVTTPGSVLLQVFMIKASGEVFMNQVYIQLPVSAGEGAHPTPTSDSPAPHVH